MLANRSQSTARLAQSQAGKPVYYFTSLTKFQRCPLGRLPVTFPSIDNVRRLLLRLIWPKYLSFLFCISFRSCLEIWSFSRTVSFFFFDCFILSHSLLWYLLLLQCLDKWIFWLAAGSVTSLRFFWQLHGSAPIHSTAAVTFTLLRLTLFAIRTFCLHLGTIYRGPCLINTGWFMRFQVQDGVFMYLRNETCST